MICFHSILANGSVYHYSIALFSSIVLYSLRLVGVICSQYSLYSLCTATRLCNYEIILSLPSAMQTIWSYIFNYLCYNVLYFRGLSTVLPELPELHKPISQLVFFLMNIS